MSDLTAGVARAVITPPVGIALTGFAGRGPAEGVHDELQATALALASGNTLALILTADLLYFPAALTADIRAAIEQRTGVPARSILLCASHTHYGPATGEGDGAETPADIAAYLAHLKYVLAGTAQAALARLHPVRLGFGEGESFIGINRRERRPDGRIVLGQNPAGPCDRSVRVVRLDTTEGTPLVALVNFACHPVSAASAMRLVSADYIAEMRRLVETFTGATCLFLQGAAGNINPVEMRHSMEPARRLGVMLGGEAAKVFESIVPTPSEEGLAVESVEAALPALTFPSLEEGERSVADLRAEVERQRADNAASGSLYWAETRLRRAEAMLASLRGGPPLPPIPAELTALRVGDIAFVTAPGEIFTETGMEVKRRSPLPKTCFVGYTNGSIGYVPIPAAYAEGGYEVTHACRVAPEAVQIIVETSLRILAEIA